MKTSESLCPNMDALALADCGTSIFWIRLSFADCGRAIHTCTRIHSSANPNKHLDANPYLGSNSHTNSDFEINCKDGYSNENSQGFNGNGDSSDSHSWTNHLPNLNIIRRARGCGLRGWDNFNGHRQRSMFPPWRGSILDLSVAG